MYYKSNPSNYTRCEKCKHIDREKEECKITNDKWLVSDDAGTCHQYEGVNMKVKTIKPITGLTLGDIYPVIDEGDNYYLIKNDFGREQSFLKELFEVMTNEKLDVDLSSKYYAKLDFLIDSETAKKNFEENMKKVGELVSKCAINSDGILDIPTKKNESDAIKPSHYKAGKFDVIAFCFEHDLDFATGNIIKYVTRAGKKDKDKTLEDLEKAMEYLKRKIERVKAND